MAGPPLLAAAAAACPLHRLLPRLLLHWWPHYLCNIATALSNLISTKPFVVTVCSIGMHTNEHSALPPRTVYLWSRLHLLSAPPADYRPLLLVEELGQARRLE